MDIGFSCFFFTTWIGSPSTNNQIIQGFAINGENAGDVSGIVSNAGDVNGDGLDVKSSKPSPLTSPALETKSPLLSSVCSPLFVLGLEF
jgi:hypothetical protein